MVPFRKGKQEELIEFDKEKVVKRQIIKIDKNKKKTKKTTTKNNKKNKKNNNN